MRGASDTTSRRLICVVVRNQEVAMFIAGFIVGVFMTVIGLALWAGMD